MNIPDLINGSFEMLGGLNIAIANSVWVGQMIYYKNSGNVV